MQASSRRPLVRRSFLALGALVPALVGAQSTTIDFGTAGGFGGLQCISGGTAISLPGPLGGLNFAGLRIAQVPGGQCVATNSGLGTNVATITAVGGGTFSFQNSILAGTFSTTDLTITGFLGASTVFSQALSGLPNGQTSRPVFTSPNVSAIDRLTITATGANAANQPFIVDNFTFGPAVAASAVPEPATVTLIAGGLLALGGLGLRRRRADG